MITSVRLQNFKCFADKTIALRPLTMLTGQNGTGKSSIIQSLLLLRQSALAGMLPTKGLLLNGDLVSLGTSFDVLYEGAQAESVSITLADDGPAESAWSFDASKRDVDVLAVLSETRPPAFTEAPFGPAFQYLAAERIGPREVHLASNYHVAQLGELGSDGRYAVAYLHEHATTTVAPAMCRGDASSTRLIDQAAAWLGEISPGVRLDTERYRDLNRAALMVTFQSRTVTSRKLRPTGVGFGVSYTLPVLVALLASRPGALVLLENPEAHLHPRGQMAMGELMAAAAAAGVHVLVETHSDHVLNGARLAVKRGTLKPADLGLNYFSRADDGQRIVHNVASPTVNADGRLDSWPEGFFDQWDLALEKLL